MTRLNHLLNLHIALWLAKDFAWCANHAVLGAWIAGATLLVAGWIAWESGS